MFDRQSIHIALLMWGCIFSLIAALCMYMSKNFDSKKRKWMLMMQLASAVLLGFDAMAWRYRGYSGMKGFYMVRISNFIVFLFSNLILILFHTYVCIYLFEHTKYLQKKFKHAVGVVYIDAVFAMVLVVISQFTHLYYYFDEQNYYHRNPANILSMLIPMIGMLIDLYLILANRKNISREIRTAMISYIVLPLIAAIIQMFYYGVSLINLAIVISMIMMFVTAMVEQNHELANKEKEAADLKISLMLSQIAPHFIYNALTTIRQLCLKDPQEAYDTVTDFSKYLRGNIDSLTQKQKIPFEQELEHTKCYLAIEQKRFGDRVRVSYDIRAKDFQIPPLSLQPIVENAVKHGICKKENGGTVWISTRREKNLIYIIVQDDGKGFDLQNISVKDGSHTGLRNVEIRLKDMCHGRMYIKSKERKGTRVEMIFPE